MIKFQYRSLLTILLATNLQVFAEQLDTTEYLIAPTCFLDNNNFEHQKHAYNKVKDLTLFSVENNYWQSQLPNLQSHSYINSTNTPCGKFISINNDLQEYLDSSRSWRSNQSITTSDFDFFLQEYIAANQQITSQKFTSLVQDKIDEEEKAAIINKLFESVKKTRINASLKKFTRFYNRGSSTQDGLRAAATLRKWLEVLGEKNNKSKEEFIVEYIATNKKYFQPSVMAILGKDLPGKAIVISAHLDTLNNGRMPGADDNGAGSMVVLEAARVILQSQEKFNRPIYFIWYAAEEMGLVGSKQVVNTIKDKNTEIDSVLHYDVIGYNPENNPKIWFVQDYVNLEFTDYLANLTTKFVGIPVDFTKCGYACSDHASWTQQGFISAAAFGTSYQDHNPNIHSENDSIDTINLDNLVNFAKLSLAYIVDRAM